MDTNIKFLKNFFHSDNRGDFKKYYNKKILQEYGINHSFEEFFVSTSKKNVIRGMHFQGTKYKTSKLISVICGEILDVIVNIKKDDKDFGKVYSFTLTEKYTLYIPNYYAHGFLSLSDNTCISYLQEKSYNKEQDLGIKYDSINFNWQIAKPILSERDRYLPTLEEYKKKI